MPVKPQEDDVRMEQSASPPSLTTEEENSEYRHYGNKLGIKSVMETSHSDGLPMKKLPNSAIVQPSSDPYFMEDNIFLQKQAAKEQDLKQTGSKLHQDKNDTSLNSTTSESISEPTSGMSSPESLASSSFEQLSLSSLSSGPQPASAVHTSPESDLLSSFIIKPEEYPAKFKQHHYDCLLIHSRSEADKKTAVNFKKIVERNLVLDDNRPPRVCMLDDGELANIQSHFMQLGEAVERSTTILLFMTKEFVNDSWANLQKDECLMVSLNDPVKRWCVVPLHTQSKSSRDFRYPFGLQALKGMDVWNMVNGKNLSDVDPDSIRKSDLNERFIQNLKSLFNQRLSLKLERERKQDEELQKWMIEERLRQARKAYILQQEQAQSKIESGKPPPSQKQINEVIEKIHTAGLSVQDVLSVMPTEGVNVFINHCDNVQVGRNNIQHVNTAEASVDNSSLSTRYEVIEEESGQSIHMDVSEETMQSEQQSYNGSMESTHLKQV